MSRTCRSMTKRRKSAPLGEVDDGVDIGAVFPDGRGDHAERAGLVQERDHDLGRIERRRRVLQVPAHVEPQLRPIVEIDQRGRMDRIDDDAVFLANADDPLARHRSALWARTCTGVSRSMPRSGSAPPASDSPGTRNTRSAAFGKPNQPLSFCGTAGPGLRSSLKFGNTARTTSVEKISPRPTPMNTSSIEARARRGSAALSFASVNFLPARSNARSTIWRPSPPNCAFAASRVARRMAARARPVTTTLSHAAGGEPALGARDQHLVAVVQFRDQRRDAAVDLRADRRIADVGMDRIGEVDRRRAARAARSAAPWG